MERFDPGSEMGDEVVEARGHKRLVSWSLGEDDAFCSMTDGAVTVEVANPHEWQDLYAEAGRLTGDEMTACDLACERLRWLMEQRDQVELDRRHGSPG